MEQQTLVKYGMIEHHTHIKYFILILFLFTNTGLACSIDKWTNAIGIVETTEEISYEGDCSLKITKSLSYVEDHTPMLVTPEVTTYTVSFYINTNYFSTKTNTIIFQALTLDSKELTVVTTPNRYIFVSYNDKTTSLIEVHNGWQKLTLLWKSGEQLLLISSEVISNIDNINNTVIQQAKLGVVSNSIIVGTIYFDYYVSTREYINNNICKYNSTYF